MFSLGLRRSSNFTLFQIRRNLFTEEFLGITMMKEKQDIVLKNFKEQNIKPSLFRDNLLINSNHELENSIALTKERTPDTIILTEDLLNLIMTSNSKKSLQETVNFFRDYVLSQDEGWKQQKLIKLFRSLLQVCHVEKDMTAIETLLKDEGFLKKLGILQKKGFYPANVIVILNIYLDHLYEAKRYEDVLTKFDEIKSKSSELPWPTITLAMMSCLKLNTQESYIKATEIFADCSEYLQKLPRISHPYALLAYNNGQIVEAYEIVSNGARRSTVKIGIKVFFLTKLNKISAAIRVLENTLKFESRKDAPLGKARAEKITFSMETVKCLTEAVENSGDPNLQLRLSKLYKKMDTVAAISNKTLLDVVTETIDITKDMKYHRQKNRLMLTQKATSTTDIQLEDLQDMEDEFEHNKEKM